jgi:hypothetical protein
MIDDIIDYHVTNQTLTKEQALIQSPNVIQHRIQIAKGCCFASLGKTAQQHGKHYPI